MCSSTIWWKTCINCMIYIYFVIMFCITPINVLEMLPWQLNSNVFYFHWNQMSPLVSISCFEVLFANIKCNIQVHNDSVESTKNTAWKSARIRGYSVRMRKNTDQNNSEYAHISRSGIHIIFLGTSKNAKYNAKYKFIWNSVECGKNPSRI